MIRLILGRAGTGKTARIFAEIAALVRAEKGPAALLVPEQYSHEAERELCRAAGDRLSLTGEVLSFTGLARRVQARFGGGARPVMDRGGRLLCMAWALDRLPPEGLRLFRRGRKDARTAELLVRGMEELRAAGADAETLLSAAAREGLDAPLAEKLRELALIAEAYAAALGRSAADPAEVLDTLARRISDDPAVRAWAAGTVFFIDGFSDFTVLEQQVLAALLRAGASMTVCLTCGDEGADDGLFSLTEGTARWLRDTAAEAGIPCVTERMEPEGPDTPIRFLAEHLYDFAPANAPADDGSVRLVAAEDPYAECELAASRMAELARQGARWRDMAVAIRGFGDYRAALESACARYGVPLFLSGRGDTLQKSVPLLIASALEAVTRGYEYEAVFGVLKTGLAPLTLEETDRLEDYALLWDLRGAMWRRPFTMHPDGYNQRPGGDAEARLADLNALRERAITPLLALETAMNAASDARGQAQALADFLADIDLAERLAARADELSAVGRREAAAEYAQLWEVVCAALAQFAAVLGDTPMDGAQFRDLFCRMLSTYDVGVIPVSLDRVQAGDFDGMRRRELRHLFILGAADGRLPAPDETAGVFTPEEREELTDLGLPLGGPEEDVRRELWRIYSCLSLPSESLYLSWPRTVDGEEAPPSAVIERAAALLGIGPVSGDLRRARTFSREAAYALAVRGEAGDPAPECLAARALFRREGAGDELAALVSRAKAGRGRLGPDAVRGLYGEAPAVTATRAEKFGDCRFAYFLQYGLKARPRQKAVFDARDNGTFLHWVLERVARAVCGPEIGGFEKATEADVDRLTDRFVDEYIREELNDFSEKTARFEYLFRRLRSTVRHVTRELWRELRVSQFRPVDFELDLNAADVLAAGEDGLRLYGFVDRVDAWEHDDRLYLRVVDYKTGLKDFKLSDIVEGANMQMLLYLFTLAEHGRAHFGGGRELVPAGVLYSPARFRVVRAERDPSDDELASLRESDTTGGSGERCGLILRDETVIEAMEPGPEKHFLPVKYSAKTGELLANEGKLATLAQFGALRRFIGKTLTDMAAELRAGSVAADPWYRSAAENACARCEFADACQFDEASDAWRMRESLRPAEAWKQIEEAVGQDDA